MDEENGNHMQDVEKWKLKRRQKKGLNGDEINQPLPSFRNDQTETIFQSLDVLPSLSVNRSTTSPIGHHTMMNGSRDNVKQSVARKEKFRKEFEKKELTMKRMSEFDNFGFTIEECSDYSSVQIGHVIPGGSAEQAGLACMDRLIEINGQDVRNMPMDSTSKLIKDRFKLGHISMIVLTLKEEDGGGVDGKGESVLHHETTNGVMQSDKAVISTSEIVQEKEEEIQPSKRLTNDMRELNISSVVLLDDPEEKSGLCDNAAKQVDNEKDESLNIDLTGKCSERKQAGPQKPVSTDKTTGEQLAIPRVERNESGQLGSWATSDASSVEIEDYNPTNNREISQHSGEVTSDKYVGSKVSNLRSAFEQNKEKSPTKPIATSKQNLLSIGKQNTNLPLRDGNSIEVGHPSPKGLPQKRPDFTAIRSSDGQCSMQKSEISFNLSRRDQNKEYNPGWVNGSMGSNEIPKGNRTVVIERDEDIDQLITNRVNNGHQCHQEIDRPGSQGSHHEVSSDEVCTACGKRLGSGTAVRIESLQVYFHMACFRCFECGRILEMTNEGVDVEVRSNHRLCCDKCSLVFKGFKHRNL